MYLHLLELIHAVDDTEVVERWLSRAGLDDILIRTEQHNKKTLALLADDDMLAELYARLRHCPVISSCEGKRKAVYRILTPIAPERFIYSFPLGMGDEWYQGNENTVYLCMQFHDFSDEQISWLATCRYIVSWEPFFDLVPIKL